jgi:hypothetical protein
LKTRLLLCTRFNLNDFEEKFLLSIAQVATEQWRSVFSALVIFFEEITLLDKRSTLRGLNYFAVQLIKISLYSKSLMTYTNRILNPGHWER